ncbi:unnamed protein product [Adineta ricciae]|uniref:Uncharacterized protein n=1 Tax=Adineta ricciae TaxID=249248 RepID=A0A813QQX7_ADIRI|nr:unnamed protein product [Adineta ricciae]
MISLFGETDEDLLALEILLFKLCSTEDESNLCFNHLYKYERNQRCTILMIAILKHRANLVRMLLSKFRKSIDLEMKGSVRCRSSLHHEMSALCAAICAGNLDLIKLLIEHGADVHTVSDYDTTPLHVATILCRFDIVQYLVEEAHADVHRTNKRNVTCLNMAGILGHLQLIEYFFKQPGTDINHQTNGGQTTLHYAVIMNRIDAIKLLLSYNARIDIQNDEMMTPLEIAAVDLREEIVNYSLNVEDMVRVRDKIDILELLGASLLCARHEFQHYDRGYQYLMQAMILRMSNGIEKTPNKPISVYKNHVECLSIAELESIRYNNDGLRLEALLICERLLSSKNNMELVDCIQRESWLCYSNSEYERGIDLSLRGLQFSIINDHMNINNRNRMFYISQVTRDIGEVYLEILSFGNVFIPTRRFLECFQLSIDRFRRLYRKLLAAPEKVMQIAHNYYMNSILFLIYVSTKICFTSNEQEQLCRLIQWINRLNIFTKFDRSTLLHLFCHPHFSLKISQTEISFLCADAVKLLIECDFDVNAVDINGNTPLHILFRNISDTQLTIAETILDIFLRTNRFHPDYVNKQGKTLLDCTANSQLIELFKRKVVLSLKCQCALRLNQMKINHESYLSRNLIEFVRKHK